jgi:hypothetical protein
MENTCDGGSDGQKEAQNEDRCRPVELTVSVLLVLVFPAAAGGTTLGTDTTTAYEGRTDQ